MHHRSVMWLSHICRVTSSSIRVRVNLNVFKSASSHDLVESQNCPVIGLQARIYFGSNKIKHCPTLFCF